jgi:D-glycero-D-manno-heptose 1,7-bisphosphate phosphatase
MKYKQINKQNISVEILSKKSFINSPCLFLDRDGVLVDWKNYRMEIENAKLVSGCDKIIKNCNKKKIPVILITNQGGIGLGLHTWDDFEKIQKIIINKLLKKGAQIDGVIACPHHPLAKGKYKHKNHPCRKPNGGMFLIAKKLFRIDLKKSWMVGDKINDLIAANSKNLKRGFLVLTGYGKEEKQKMNLLPKNFFAVKILSSLKNLKITF